ncbi:hypothetical protein Syn7502_01089 [Synechococcus sp. PCC 7502]|uniref:hypothetical protein n=1 Tax=Synechococcus sp. PCC 7502 TaxID=1173263 RepID=UPI00029F8BD7|nr:hypothetical protein [Synechococcus sp. PCC 7502]AFY73199.1 hypothetical protein Syn7502_01089 [Synechococcus sp. PCC 7502]
MQLIKLAINLGAIAAFALTSIGLQLPRLQQKLVGQTPEADQRWIQQEKARLKFLNQLPPKGFGFNNIIADLTFLGFLQYFGDDVARLKNKTGYVLSPDYFDVIISRDPRHIYAYLFMSNSVTLFAAQPHRAITLYEQGLPFIIPEKQYDAYTVWRRRAIDELLFLGDSAAARKSYLKAAEWADRATFPPDALPETKFVAAYSRASAEFLRQDPNSSAARISAWGSVLTSAVDQKTFQIAVNELDKLGMLVQTDAQGRLQLVPKSKNP